MSPYESTAEARGTRNIMLARLLSEESDVTLICTRFSHGKKKFWPISAFKKSEKFKTYFLPTLSYKSNLSVRRVLAHWITAFSSLYYVITKTSKGDSIVASSIPPEVLLLTSLGVRLKGGNLHIDVRDIWPDAFPLAGKVSSLFSIYCNVLNKLAFKLNKVTVSYVAQSFFNWIEKVIPSNRIKSCQFIPLGFDQLRWQDRPTMTVKDSSVVKLVYIGYLESQFDISQVINAVKNSSGYELIVIGGGSKSEYYKSIAEGADNVKFLGTLSLDEAAEQVMNADIGVLPISHTAQMPNKLFDYLGAGLPILAIGESDSASFVKKHSIGWTTDFSQEAIEALLTKMDSEKLNFCKRNVVTVRVEFSKDVIYKKLVHTINN